MRNTIKNICHYSFRVNEKEFTILLNNWHEKWKNFLKEKTYHENNKWSYTHKNLKSVYRSLKTNLSYLFTYQKVKNLPNTTNHLDGGVFSHLKKLLKVYAGISKKFRRKIIDDLLNSGLQKFH